MNYRILKISEIINHFSLSIIFTNMLNFIMFCNCQNIKVIAVYLT